MSALPDSTLDDTVILEVERGGEENEFRPRASSDPGRRGSTSSGSRSRSSSAPPTLGNGVMILDLSNADDPVAGRGIKRSASPIKAPQVRRSCRRSVAPDWFVPT